MGTSWGRTSSGQQALTRLHVLGQANSLQLSGQCMEATGITKHVCALPLNHRRPLLHHRLPHPLGRCALCAGSTARSARSALAPGAAALPWRRASGRGHAPGGRHSRGLSVRCWVAWPFPPQLWPGGGPDVRCVAQPGGAGGGGQQQPAWHTWQQRGVQPWGWQGGWGL